MSESGENTTVVAKKKNRIIPVIIGCAAVVLAMAVVLIVVLGASSKKHKLQEKLDMGSKYLTDLDYENAILAYSEAIAINPRSAEAYLGIAEAYIGMGDFDSALQYLQDGYDKTQNSDIQNKIDEINQILKDGRPVKLGEWVTVTGEIFFSKDKPELFPEEWNNHVGGKSNPTYGIQFDKEIKCLTGGKIVSVKVAEQTHVSTLDLEGFINKKCEMKGYFSEQNDEMPNGIQDDGTYHYNPYEFDFCINEIVVLEDIEAVEEKNYEIDEEGWAVVRGEDLTVRVRGKEFEVILETPGLQPVYICNDPSIEEYDTYYDWTVTFTDGKYRYVVGTFAGNFPGLPVQRTINDMETVFQIENPNNNDVDVVSANVRAEGNKLIYTGVIEKRDEWDSVPDGYEGFDIENLKLVNYNIVDEMGYHSKEY